MAISFPTKNIRGRTVSNKSSLRIWSLNYRKWSAILHRSLQVCARGKHFLDITVYICADLDYSPALKNSCACNWSCTTHIICIQNKTQVFIIILKMSSHYVGGEAIVIAMICKNSEPKQRKRREVWVNPRL